MTIHTTFVVAMMVAGAMALTGCDSSEPVSAQAPPISAAAALAPTRDCFWALRSDPDVLNVLYPDRAATYWVATLAIPSGGKLRFEGRYPQARYMSFNLYNPRLEPIDALADVEIAPDAGSMQPFAVGAPRQAAPRNYTVQVVAGTRPDEISARVPNTLYSYAAAGQTQLPSPLAVAIYRVYLPDSGQDLTGGTGLPQVVLTLADGQELRGIEACTVLEQAPALNLSEAINALELPDLVPNTGAFAHLQWLKFFDLLSAQANRFNASPLGPVVGGNLGQASNNTGGFASNVHNNYIYASLSRTIAPVVAVAARAPHTPRTQAGEALMQDGDLRYLSFCTNDGNSTRYFDCVYDEQILRDAEDRYVLVVSRVGDRPANARAECGVTWLNWGPLTQSLLIYRHMLPKSEAEFPAAIQYIPGPPGAHEAEVMGEYYPDGRHFDQAAFEALGCPVDPATILSGT